MDLPQEKLKGLDLFSGISGISTALSEWVKPLCYCENDQYAQAVLLSRMSDGSITPAPIWDNVETLTGEMLPDIDIIYGGFPCQDISVAGKGRGLAGKRSGLFFQVVRLVSELRPRFVFLENVPAITTKGLKRVTEEMAELRYDLRWGLLSASDVGANHKRERWFLLGYTQYHGRYGLEKPRSTEEAVHCSEEGSNQASQSQRASASRVLARESFQGRGAGEVSVANSQGDQEDGELRTAQPFDDKGNSRMVSTSGSHGQSKKETSKTVANTIGSVSRGREISSDPDFQGRKGSTAQRESVQSKDGEARTDHTKSSSADVSHTNNAGCSEQRWYFTAYTQLEASKRRSWWSVKSWFCGVPDELSKGVDKDNPRIPSQKEVEYFVSKLEETVLYAWGVYYGIKKIDNLWGALTDEERYWSVNAVSAGWWESEWPGVSRITVEKLDRVARLKCLGNAVVVEQARTAFMKLMGIPLKKLEDA